MTDAAYRVIPTDENRAIFNVVLKDKNETEAIGNYMRKSGRTRLVYSTAFPLNRRTPHYGDRLQFHRHYRGVGVDFQTVSPHPG